MIKDYMSFINESIISKKYTVLFTMSERLVDVFEYIGLRKDKVGILANSILDLNNKNIHSTITLLDIEDTNSISFINSEKYKEIYKQEFEDSFVDSSEIQLLIHKYNKYSNPFRIGRLVLKLIELYEQEFNYSLEYTNKTIEDFTNEYKYIVDLSKGKMENFKIVPASEIPDYYIHTSYSSIKGTLGRSCMKYEESQDYLYFYTQMSDSLNLLVYLDDNKKVLGRSLLWNLENGQKFMDRIYTNNDYDVKLFIKWAQKNKVIYKENQDSSSLTYLYKPEDYKKSERLRINVKVKPIKAEQSYLFQFPYLDTLKYFYWEYGILSNMTISGGHYIRLENVDGEFECSYCFTEGIVNCEYCDDESTDCKKCNNTKSMPCPTCGNYINKN